MFVVFLEGYIGTQTRRGPVKIEDVIEWRLVVEKFLLVSGQASQNDDDEDSSVDSSQTQNNTAEKIEANGIGV